jgi:hypothetical protein
VDDAAHEINMRWGSPLGNSADPEFEPMDQDLVRETAEAILHPVEDELSALRAVCGTVLGILCNIRDEASDAREIHDGGEEPIEVEVLAILDAAKRGVGALAVVLGIELDG